MPVSNSLSNTVPARYWTPLAGGRVRCEVCPRECELGEGQRGLCFVRKNEGSKVVLTTYGRSSGFCVDPVEKKPLNHFLPGSPILSFGTAGCNLSCKFCQNWDISKSREMDTLADQAGPADIVAAALALGCKSIAFTYNDPVIFLEYAVDVAKAAKAAGLKSVAVTAGYIKPEARKEFYSHMDAANIDLKGFSEGFYKKLCSAELSAVLDTLKYVRHETGTWLEITNLMIPGENDSPEETKAMCQWIMKELGPEVPLHFTAFHPDFKMLEHGPTPPATLAAARKIAMECGLRHAYTGNVHDEEGSSTWCHACGGKLVGRNWFELGDWNLNARGECAHCGAVCPGVFEDRPGTWGARRLPVVLGEI